MREIIFSTIKVKRKGPDLGDWVDDFLADVNVKGSINIVNEIAKWVPASPGEFKINTDAAVNVEAGEIGIGAICRNSFEAAHAWFSLPLSMAKAILFGIKLAADLNVENYSIESDNFKEALHDFGVMLIDVKQLPSSFVGFYHVKRAGNVPAHPFAKFSFGGQNNQVLDFPFCVNSAVMTDLPHPNV